MTWLVNGLKDSLIYFGVKNPVTNVIDYTKITDHNRSPLGVSIEQISNSQRTANGTMRKSIIANKHSFDLSWNDFPNMSTYTVDGGWGGSQIYDFYLDTTQPFYIKITQKIDSDAANAYQEYLVNFASCSFDIVKRNPSATTPYIRMNMNLSLEEV
jgi:hypothetical protein